MRKRVGIARALVLEPELVLFDEPTAGLDPTNARLVAELVASLKAEGASDTAMIVTHDLEFARSVSDQMAVLIGGRSPQVGPPEEIRHSAKPRSGLPGRRGAADHGRGRPARAPRCSSASAPSSWRACSCSWGSSTCSGRGGPASSASTTWSRVRRGGRAHRGRHRAAGRRADRAASARSGCPSRGEQGAGRAPDRAALPGPHPRGLGGPDRDPGAARRQDRRHHPGQPGGGVLQDGGELRTEEPFDTARLTQQGAELLRQPGRALGRAPDDPRAHHGEHGRGRRRGDPAGAPEPRHRDRAGAGGAPSPRLRPEARIGACRRGRDPAAGRGDRAPDRSRARRSPDGQSGRRGGADPRRGPARPRSG